MTYNDPETLPQYRVPEDTTLDTFGEYLKKIIKAYAKGYISLGDILNHGDAINCFIYNKYIDSEKAEYPTFPKSDPRSIPLNVLEYFESTAFFMIPRDVNYFLEFLDTPLGCEKEGWAKFHAYIKSQTLRKRIDDEIKQGVCYGESHGFNLDKPFEPL
ncbi:hypothetical protein [Candidatus Bodocaedibacter vickermanii]|uniref:Uncharacterized protein n=1 Tax=Candidatus Bodocaedibacter vickermanii TaxID=2741701 RepID=A0A7L9RSE3_9PROT|nr:hypothetical protein CPBP_00212 [Candidatus Paracaedibacteraceae bacterium 'Lake Konstanz']